MYEYDRLHLDCKALAQKITTALSVRNHNTGKNCDENMHKYIYLNLRKILYCIMFTIMYPILRICWGQALTMVSNK